MERRPELIADFLLLELLLDFLLWLVCTIALAWMEHGTYHVAFGGLLIVLVVLTTKLFVKCFACLVYKGQQGTSVQDPFVISFQ
jgi:hypothetical protein